MVIFCNRLRIDAIFRFLGTVACFSALWPPHPNLQTVYCPLQSRLHRVVENLLVPHRTLDHFLHGREIYTIASRSSAPEHSLFPFLTHPFPSSSTIPHSIPIALHISVSPLLPPPSHQTSKQTKKGTHLDWPRNPWPSARERSDRPALSPRSRPRFRG